jgi:hypothetical protein
VVQRKYDQTFGLNFSGIGGDQADIHKCGFNSYL